MTRRGNSSRAEVNVKVKEGTRNTPGENCTNPVNVPDENLRSELENALGLARGQAITCEALAGLTELSRTGTDSNDSLVEFSTLEGLQFAVNLEVLDFTDSVFNDFSAISNLSKLEKLTLKRFVTPPSLEPLRGLTSLTELNLGGPFSEPEGFAQDVDALASLVNLQVLRVGDLNLAQVAFAKGLTKLEQLSLVDNEISDITPLLGNEGLGEGDTVELAENPLETCPGTEDRAAIDTLIGRGVDVSFDEPENCDGEGEDNGTSPAQTLSRFLTPYSRRPFLRKLALTVKSLAKT